MRIQSIRVKITAITIAAILTSILSVFVACNSTIQRENDRKSVEMMNLIVSDTRKSLEKSFESIEQSVEVAANLAGDTMDSVMLVECGGTSALGAQRTEQQQARLDAYLADYCPNVEETFASVAGHTQGVVSYYYCINPEVSQTEHGFFSSKVGKTGFVKKGPVDAGKLDPKDLDHNTWYFTPIKRGRPSWVGPYQGQSQGDLWLFSYVVPIFKSGTLIGVLGMDIPVESFTSQVRSIRVYQTGFACLFDAEGRVLYHPQMSFHGTPDTMGSSLPTGTLNQDNNGEALIRYTENGERRQMSFCTLSNGMKLVVTAPEREINASWINLSRIILWITAVVIVIFAAILLFVMRIITSPLLRLTAASRRLANEDYDVELNYRSNDEVGELTRSFSRMRDQLKRNIEDLNRKVYTDDLTGLPNMRHFFLLAERERQRILQQGGKPVMLYFNLIGMKHYNRQYGLAAGDDLIREVAVILSRHYGDRCLCHYGQDRFAAVTTEKGMEEELQAVFQECTQVKAHRALPVRVGIYQHSLESVSVSVACDRAKYACDQNRDSFVSGYYYFDSAMLRQVENLRYIINHLDQALREGWVQVYYQPIVRAANGKVCDEEALSRWFDPVKGMFSPGDFIPILENSRLIYKLDLYVLEQILKKMREQEAMGMPMVPHSVNLSRVDFEVCDIVEEVRRRVDEAGVPRSRLTIEVTESVIGSNFEFMKEQIERFRALGFPVWMDDFGSGYSSLDVLQEVSFDLIKFDMRFMHRFGQGEESKIILTELIRMAIGLGIETVCEGVENQEQVDFLREAGCTKLQGFHFSRPVPFEVIQSRKLRGTLIGFENPEESSYYKSIGRVNLFDLTVMTDAEQGAHTGFFNTLPVGIMELFDGRVRFVRTNRPYREFMKQYFHFDLVEQSCCYDSEPFGTGSSFMKAVRQCYKDGGSAFVDEDMPDGSIVHSFIRRVGINPVNGTVAVAAAVLSITSAEEGATYASIARALATDYYRICCVDMDTERYIEYRAPVSGEELAPVRHGEDFFASARRGAGKLVFEEDRKAFLSVFTKENILSALDGMGVFNTAFRLMENGVPVAVSLRAKRMNPGGRRIIIGIRCLPHQDLAV